jgi:hypothetical protein
MTTEKKKGAFNPKLGNGFENAAFGEGSILVNIDAEGLDVAMKNLQVGSSILLKYNKVTSKGNKHYFAEILPPYKRPTPTTTKKAATNDLD